MNRKVLIFTWLAPVLVLLFVSGTFNHAFAFEQDNYYVEEGAVLLELDGFPGKNREEFADFCLVRTEDSTQPFDFSITDLVDDDGHLFPRHLIGIKTPYDSRAQKVSPASKQMRLLAGGDEYADLKLIVFYDEQVRAGIYQGYLRSGQGKDISIRIIVRRVTRVRVTPEKIFLQIPGPGQYEVEPIEVTVRANHGDWVLNLSCSGLFYQGEDINGSRPFDEKLLERPYLQLFVAGEETMPVNEVPHIVGRQYGWGTTFTFVLQTKVGWEHRAGDYFGVIRVDVSLQE